MYVRKKSKFLLMLVPLLAMSTSFKNVSRSSGPDHIVILIEENHSYAQIVGSTDAPYINSLIKQGLSFTNSHGVIHPSQANYIALYSGSTQGVEGDRCLEKETPFSTPNLGHALISNGLTFSGYSESMPRMGFTGCGFADSVGGHYARKHSPWVNWQGDSPTGLSDSTNLTFRDFPSDFSKLPTVSIVIPNLGNDMHDGSIKKGDDWVKHNMDAYIQWAKKNNSLFILTFDEDDFTKANHIATIFVGAGIKANTKDANRINHYNILRTIENFYKLPASGSAKEKLIAGVWKN
ncbi:MAG: alkaline phosphatase family protein [Ginsengibacter sp.]